MKLTDCNDSNLQKQPRVAVVTGATGAIGKAIARAIAGDAAFEVVLVGRNEAKLQQIARNIQAETQNPAVSWEIADLSQRASIEELAGRWGKPVHVLVNNAAIAPSERQETPEGIELQFATNVLGYIWMAQAFRECLIKTAPARIINVASYWAGDLVMEDLEFKRRTYNNNLAYRQSKQADRMLTVALAERFEPYQVSVNACHPGDVASTLSQQLGFGGFETPDSGAKTPAWLAVDPEVGQVTGKYFEHQREVRCSFGSNHKAVEMLFKIVSRYDEAAAW